VWLARQVSLAGARRVVGGFNHGSLGPGLPLALGAAALDPRRQVWALCGDGGFGMSMNDFVTAVRFGWPIKVIVFDNSELSFVKMEMEVAGLPVYPEATGLLNPDFALFAKACGGDGVRVEHAADVVPAIEQAIASDKPFIIDAIVSPGELTMPPHIEVSQGLGLRHLQGQGGAHGPPGRPRSVEGLARRVPGEPRVSQARLRARRNAGTADTWLGAHARGEDPTMSGGARIQPKA
jgi:pyruvate dehydrogenase (quinone)